MVYRANGKPESILGGILFEAPPAQCNVLQIWPTGDAPFCSEGQAKNMARYVKSPGAFK